MLASKANVSGMNVRSGKLNDQELGLIYEANQILSRGGFYIDDTPGIKVSEMISKCRQLKKRIPLDLIIVDYIQLIQGSGKAESRQLEVSEISRRLKALARELEVPVIALSQLSRNVETRNDKRPMLSDLRESGALEQDADLVMFIYRDDYYIDKNKDEQNTTPVTDGPQTAELSLAKHRNGPTGLVNLAFDKNTGRFMSVLKERVNV